MGTDVPINRGWPGPAFARLPTRLPVAVVAALCGLLLAACDTSPNRRTLREAESLIEQNQLGRAYTMLDDLYHTDPKATEAREMQIVILLKINQPDAAIEMYKQLAARGPLVTFLNGALRDPDPIVRANLCRLIAVTKPSNSIYLLSKASHDSDRAVRRAAVRRLSEFRGKKVRQSLEFALLDHSWEVRADAAGGLEQLGDPAASDNLFQTMLDDDEFVRLRARRALATLISDRNVSVYRRALKQGNGPVRIAAALALATRGEDDATSALYEALRDRDPSVRLGAARALATMGDRSARPLLRESLGDSNAQVRATAALALAELGDVISTNSLAILAEIDPVEEVRVAAAQAILLLSPPPSALSVSPPPLYSPER